MPSSLATMALLWCVVGAPLSVTLVTTWQGQQVAVVDDSVNGDISSIELEVVHNENVDLSLLVHQTCSSSSGKDGKDCGFREPVK